MDRTDNKQKQMEETNEPIEEKELEAPDMDNNMRGEDDHIDIGEPDTQPTPSPILKGAEEFNFENGTYKINISSAFLRADQLVEICFLFLQDIKENKTKDKPGGSYIS